MEKEKDFPVQGCLLIVVLMLVVLLISWLINWARYVGFYQKYPAGDLKPPMYGRRR